MRFKWIAAWGVVMPLLMTGCGLQSVKPGAADQLVRGTLVKEGEAYRFSPCGSADSMDVELASNTLQQEHAAHSIGDGWPVYVEAKAAAGVDPLILKQPLVIGGSLAACEYTLPNIELRAVSDDGEVVIDLRQRHIRVHYSGRLLQLGFDRPEAERLARQRRWQQTMKAGAGRKQHSVLLEVEPGACRGKSGAWYALSMTAEVNGTYYRGCARLGDLEHWPLRDLYVTPDSMNTRRLALALAREGRFRLTEDYLNNQPVNEYQGRWERLSSTQLRLHAEGSELQPITFQLNVDGELQLQGFHPAYGRSLELQPAGDMLRISSGELDWWH